MTPVVLIVLDGWGVAPDSPGNAITQASTPNMDHFWSSFPHTTLLASGEAVGLPRGEAGNTETGHLNLGAGRIVFQDVVRINSAISDGTFFKNKAFLDAIEHANKNNSNLHLMGLVGSGSVHTNLQHLFALLRLCKEQKFNRVFLHLFTDGRDSPPTSAENYLSQVEQVIKAEGVGKIATIMGRYWAMDRDLRWERTEKAYRALTEGLGAHAASAREAIEKAYEAGVTDEFINPAIVVENGKPVALISENDSVIFFNFRVDRPRQLTSGFIEDTPGFERGQKIKNLFFVSMTKYNDSLSKYTQTAFLPEQVVMPLGKVLADRNLHQLRLAESEKERFVTFYFNGQEESVFAGEERKIVASAKVPTYDKKPEMSAEEITQVLLDSLGDNNSGNYSFVLINFANSDMVGHTGDIEAAKKACEAVDKCLGQIVQKVDILGGTTIITADHGNAEEMLMQGRIHTEHTINPVPFIIVGKEFLGKSETLQSGILADIAPTVLKLLGIPKPSQMTGRALI